MSPPIESEQARPLLSPSRWLERFENQVQRHPSETAIAGARSSISYRELDERANKVAQQLSSEGIGRGKFIGLGLPRSLDLPVALLGILKAGAGYIPLDPHCPAGTLQKMIHSAKLGHVITYENLAAHFPGLLTIFTEGNQSPKVVNRTGVISASGETAPFPFPHHGAAKLLHWYSITLSGIGAQKLVVSQPSFDLSRRDFFSTLCVGGTLVLDHCREYEVERIAELVRRPGVTSIQCPAEVFNRLLDAASATDYIELSGLNSAVVDGEASSHARFREWLAHPNCHAVISHGKEFPREHLNEKPCPIRGLELRGFDLERQKTLQALPPPNDIRLKTKPLSLRAPSDVDQILSLWTQVLKRPVNDAEANFFDLGGTSIHLAMIHVQLMKMTGRKFPLHELAELPTASLISNYLAAQPPSALSEPSLVRDTPSRRERSLSRVSA
jgi:non-ribosomal peptide synthetase component F/acyl carrier protein